MYSSFLSRIACGPGQVPRPRLQRLEAGIRADSELEASATTDSVKGGAARTSPAWSRTCPKNSRTWAVRRAAPCITCVLSSPPGGAGIQISHGLFSVILRIFALGPRPSLAGCRAMPNVPANTQASESHSPDTANHIAGACQLSANRLIYPVLDLRTCSLIRSSAFAVSPALIAPRIGRCSIQDCFPRESTSLA